MAVRRGANVVGAKMVLHIATTFFICVVGKLMQNTFDRTTDHIAQHIQTTAMWHTNGDGLDSVIHGRINDRLDTGDERLTTLETETLLIRVLGSDETLK